MGISNRTLRDIFNEAVEIADATQRAAYLAAACGGDTALLQRLEALLRANNAVGPFLGGAGQAQPVSRAERLRRWCRRHPIIVSLVLASAILILAVVLGAPIWTARNARESKRAQGTEREALERQQAVTDQRWHSYVAQARATRLSNQRGRRFDSLDLLAKAAAIRSAPELRDEAIACLALSDLKVRRRFEAKLGVFDRALQRYAVAATNLGDIRIQRVSDDQEIVRLPSPAGTVRKISPFSHDGRFLPVLCQDQQLRVWDLEQGAVVLTAPGGTRYETVDFRPDDLAVAVAADRAEVSIYELATGTKTASFATPFAAMCVRYDPSGGQLAISSFGDTRVAILDPHSGATLRLLKNTAGLGETAWGFGEVAWHPRDSSLAAASKDGTIYVWDTRTGRLLQTLKGHQGEPGNVVFSHDGEVLISSGWDGTHLWHTRTGEHLLWHDAPGQLESFAPGDGLYGHSRYDLGRWLELLSFASGREARCWKANEAGADHRLVASRFLAFSSDGRWLVLGMDEGVKLFDARTGDWLVNLPTGPVAGACFQKSGRGLLVSSRRGLFRWPMRLRDGSNELAIGPPVAAGAAGAWQEAGLSENGQVFAAFHGEQACSFDAESMHELACTGSCGDPSYFRSLSISPDGRRLTTAGEQGAAVKVWDANTGALVKELADPEWTGDNLPYPAFEPTDGSLLITCRSHYRVWETNSWTPGRPVQRSDLPILAVSHLMGWVAMRHGEASIQLRDVANGELLATLQSPLPDPVLTLAFSPDDTQLAVTHSGTRELLVWDLRLIREELVKMGLDWARPPYPPAAGPPASPFPIRVAVLQQ